MPALSAESRLPAVISLCGWHAVRQAQSDNHHRVFEPRQRTQAFCEARSFAVRQPHVEHHQVRLQRLGSLQRLGRTGHRFDFVALRLQTVSCNLQPSPIDLEPPISASNFRSWCPSLVRRFHAETHSALMLPALYLYAILHIPFGDSSVGIRSITLKYLIAGKPPNDCCLTNVVGLRPCSDCLKLPSVFG